MIEKIIGGADGPTSVFIADKSGEGWLNYLGLVIVVFMMIPNIIYAIKFRNEKNLCKNKVMNMIEQVSRYTTMFLMVFNIGILEYGYQNIESFFFYIFGNIVLLLLYYVFWILYFMKQKLWISVILASIPAVIFLLSGALTVHVLLIISATIFLIAHNYVTCQNVIQKENMKIQVDKLR